MIRLLGFSIALFLVVFACKKSEEVGPANCPVEQPDSTRKRKTPQLPQKPFDYSKGIKPTYGKIDVLLLQDKSENSNPVTNHGATLGRVLFYDNALSKNYSIKCASCHIQRFGFSDTAQLSKGFKGGKTKRHSMALANARYRSSGRYFWDGRAATIEEQVLMPIQDEVEMGMSLTELVTRLDTIKYYNLLFQNAFGDSSITPDRISKALAQFVKSINSFNSKYDQGRKTHDYNVDFSNFNNQENEGKRLFHSVKKGNCGGCHFTDAMVTDIPRNNGLTVSEFGIDDEGYYTTSNNPNDKGAFTVPSLRNVAIRPPYMHNGAFNDLKSVLNGYSTGIQYTPSLDPHFVVSGKAIKFNLTEKEIESLLAFLNTLTDESLLTDERFSDPFR